MKDIGTIVGWIAAGICLLLYVSKKRERIFAIKLSAAFLWITNMLLPDSIQALWCQRLPSGEVSYSLGAEKSILKKPSRILKNLQKHKKS